MAAINVFSPQGSFLSTLPEQDLPVPKPVLALVNAATMLILYGGLGFLGLKFSQKLGFADIWDSGVSNRQRFLIPALVGIAIGVFFIFTDAILSQLYTLGSLPHPPFPTSLIASTSAGIGEEIMFRLFFISFWVWLISYVILKKRWQNQIFWAVAIFSALAFAFGHIPSVMILLGLNNINEIPFALMTKQKLAFTGRDVKEKKEFKLEVEIGNITDIYFGFDDVFTGWEDRAAPWNKPLNYGAG